MACMFNFKSGHSPIKIGNLDTWVYMDNPLVQKKDVHL